ncbi:MAG: ribosome maturation factor RimP [Candidatus Nanopelagicales bacterium]|nr:ribosome maturation factor RimP [Candidatus Nanopelagicales bacterium]
MIPVSELTLLLEPVVSTFSFDLDDIEITRSGGQKILDVTIDGDSGVNLDEVAAVSRAISEFLDNSDAMGDEPYVLEVGTRGVTKPLTKPVHWARNVGRLVNVAGDAINAVGRIVDFTDPNVTLDIKGKLKTLSIAEISRAHIEIEFKKMPKEDLEAEELSDVDESE